MQRIVSAWLPLWPIERMQRTDRLNQGSAQARDVARVSGQPFVLVESGARGLTLAAVDEPARREGLWPGQALADARAAVPRLQTRLAERTRDRAALQMLALWCGRYGPRRNCHGWDGDGPDASGTTDHGADGQVLDSLWIDITGVAHLFGGEARLLADLARHFARSGVTARIGMADSFGAAFAVARFAATGVVSAARSSAAGSCWCIVPPGGTEAALSALPVDALRLPADCVVLLKRLGLRRIGQLYDLPREALAQRFRGGAGVTASKRKREREMMRLAGVVLARLDQALERASELLVPIEEPPVFIVRQSFIEPLISAEGVAASTAMLATELCRRLGEAGQGGLRFGLALYRADGTVAQVGIGLSRPCRDPAHLIGLLAEKLAVLDAGFGIDVMTLTAIDVETLAGLQTVLPAPELAAIAVNASPLIDRLSNRLGAARVLRLVAGESHSPERAGQRWPALSGNRMSSMRSSIQAATACRPPFLLSTPEPIMVTAEVPDGPPLRFTWRRLSRRVMRAEGPERIEPEWWRSIGRASLGRDGIGRVGGRSDSPYRDCTHGDRARDYYAIEDTGGARYWVYRAGLYGCDDARPPVWFLHGVFA